MARRKISLPLLAAFAVLSLGIAHCGARPESGVATATTASSAAAAESTLVPRSADPLCGTGHRWTAGRCMVAEEERTGATEKKTASLAQRKGGDGLIVEDVTIGTGREVRAGDIVKLHYVGTLDDGSTFDSSRSQGTPFEFRVGQGEVIKGFDRGMLGMKVGGRRKVTIPYQLGYGIEGSPPRIPPKATLHFDLELLDVM